MKIINVEQGTPEWKAARVARVTASKIADILAKGKSGEAATRRDYRMQIVCEMLTNESQDEVFYNANMKWGNEQEPFARAAYEIETGTSVDQVGMVIHPDSDRCAASPDGIVGPWDGQSSPEGLIEIKCPKTSTHIGYCRAGGVPTDYQPQMLWQMACTGAQWVDFVSFDPLLGGKAEGLQLYIVRFPRDEARIKTIEAEVERFLNECDCEYNSLLKMGEAA